MGVDISTQQKFAEEMADYIFSRASGSHEKDNTTEMKPSRKYFLGNLAAAKPSPEYETDEGENRASIRAQRLESSILVDDNSINENEIMIKASGHFYYQVSNEEKENGEKKYWKKIKFSDRWNTKIKEKTKKVNFGSFISEANDDENIVKKISNDTFEAKISIKIEDYEENKKLVTFRLVNEGKEPIDGDKFDRTLYNCQLTVDLNDVKNIEFEEEYEYEGHPQRYYYDFRTVNCQAKWIDGNKFMTTNRGKFLQENIRPREELENIDFSFENMSLNEGLDDLDEFLDLIKNRLVTYENNIERKSEEDWKKRDGNREKTWGEQIEKVKDFEKLIKRVERGIEIINKEKEAKKSFLWMNETFDEYFSSYHEIKDGRWRIFQLVFILSTLQSVTHEENLDVADVVHVPTGGGKTEAYLGLVIFTLFYERLIGKEEGVSAIVKFPLRMLSVQQLERISSIIIYAEKIRSEKDELRDKGEFSIGYFVGSKNPDFPAYYKKLKDRVEDGDEQSFVLPNCPFCSSNVYLENDEEHKRIIHVCEECGREYKIYLSDREIYRWRPSFIVSTVDKWAAISMQRRMRNLLGGKGSKCPEGHGFIPSEDMCEDGRDEDFDCGQEGLPKESVDGPRLSIQDEMHLLKEGFGSISSHFEGIIEEMVKKTSDRGLKHISLSATLRGIKSQVRELYNKDSFVIPGDCPEGKGDELDLFYRKLEGPHRIIYGGMPNLRDNHYASLRTLLHQFEFLYEQQKLLSEDPNQFREKYSLSKDEGEELINNFFLPLTYHLKKQDAYDMNRLKGAVINDRLEEKSNSKIHGEVVTGDCSLYKLREIIEMIENFFDDFDSSNLLSENEKSFSEPLYATSVVSHGVDLDQLNFMVFQGLPYSTSEYIQALSRVGRKNLGVVLLWFYPTRVRDDSFYRNFKRYHDSLDHEVRPVPIKRCARLATKQTLTSIFCGGIINYLSNENGKPIYKKGDVKKLEDNDWDKLVEFIKNVYGRELEINVADEIQERKNQITEDKDFSDGRYFPRVLAENGDRYYQTQTGMRGIQKKFVLELSDPNEDIIRKWIGE